MKPFNLDIETPAIVVDHATLVRNIEKAAAMARHGNVRLRPHIKTHKSIEIANLQRTAGAQGITVAKPSEAKLFIEAGFLDVTVAFPLVDTRKIQALVECAGKHAATVSLVVDSIHGVHAIADVATRFGVNLGACLKVDVGLHRCGVDPSGEAAISLVREIADRPALRFLGILSHAGHSYAAPDGDAVHGIATAERNVMSGLAGRLRLAGLPVPDVSIGATPTLWLNDGFAGITEIRPGNYVFMDLTQCSLGVAQPDDIALSVLAMVVSCNDRYAIIDAGSKVLSSDRGPHGSTRLSGYGLALREGEDMASAYPVVSLSEEHGFLAHGGRFPKIGERVRILPNHACPVVNLAAELVVEYPDRSHEMWPVDARGCVQ